VIYLSGVVRPDMPALVTPRMGQMPPDGQPWAADNGRYSAPANYSDGTYLAWLGRMPVQSCLFATAPDVVGDAAATLALSVPMFARIRALGFPVAFVAQDGQEGLPVPWDDFDALFIGGTTEWKLGEDAAQLAREAKRRGKWVHMGRVNSLKRMRYAESIGCDSADGTVLKHDLSRPVHEWGPAVLREPSLWRPT
jgi:hypothetical protein